MRIFLDDIEVTLEELNNAWLWAVHDDHGLANNFTHTLK